jgi:fumarate reductase flavoprotein subunit
MPSDRIGNTETDVLIIGAGGAGLAASVAAREKGVNNVIALEKLGAPGGNSAMATGFFAAESKPQKQRNIDASRDMLFKMQMDFTHWRTNPRLVRAYIDKSADTVQWLEDKGVIVTDIPRHHPNQLFPTWHLVNIDGPGGRVITKALLASCEKLGVRLLRSTSAKKILTGNDGKVTGVLAISKGEEFNINAKSVIISSGGYGGNKELLKKYCPYYRDNMFLFGLPHQGDGLLMAMEVGAATEGLGIILAQAPTLGRNMRIFPLLNNGIIGEPNTLWVNKRGMRFVDESLTFTRHVSSNPVTRQPDGISYTLFDDKIIQKAVEEGVIRGTTRPIVPSTKLPGLRKEIQLAAEDKDVIKVSDSWEEIADWMGIAPDVLNATVNEYNSNCDRGCDDIFAKESKYLQALRTPPYYAAKCYPAYTTTFGGIKINHRTEVLDHEDNPIPGLYAAGDAAGGWAHDSYNIKLTGFALGFAFNSGRIAGENAAEYTMRNNLKTSTKKFVR